MIEDGTRKISYADFPWHMVLRCLQPFNSYRSNRKALFPKSTPTLQLYIYSFRIFNDIEGTPTYISRPRGLNVKFTSVAR